MAVLLATDLTYTLQQGSQAADPRYSAVFKIAIAGGSTYPGGGIPLTRAKLGCPAKLEIFQIEDAAANDGYAYKYDRTAATIRLYASGSGTHSHGFVVVGGAASAATTSVRNAAGNILGKEEAANVTYAGGLDSSTHGGVGLGVLTAAALAEIATTATVAATILYARVVGW
mgnify:CR=1 FL=1